MSIENFEHPERLHTPARWAMTCRRASIIVSQAALIVLTYYLSFLLRFDLEVKSDTKLFFFHTVALVVAMKLLALFYFGLLGGWWQYAGMAEVRDITKAALTSSIAIWAIVIFVIRLAGFPRSVLLIDLALTILIIGGARFAVRAYAEQMTTCVAQKNTLIAGAGRAGTEIARQLRRNPALDYNPVGFVDDDASKVGMKIQGMKVLGTMRNLPEVIAKRRIECVIIAIPSARGRTVERIVEKCRIAKVEFKVLQSIGRHINGQSLTQMRNLQLEDVLGREPVSLDLDKIQQKLRDKVLMVTGAGGSIGSELCTQIAKFRPRKLVLFERSENDLFKIFTELSSAFPHLDFAPVVGDILDVAALRDAFALHRPHSVFHAAAYKHVPMMEMNCFQAVTNNVFGTYNVALVARQFQVEDFVLISSDKAVKPANVMGVTKRIGELIILGLQRQNTRYVAVRFGNVLGSKGSVVPLFESQIANGGPILVTHPEAKRYFMMITEAVQLVLQASSMGRGGEIFILKMGEPVRIADLAANMIRLSGYEPDREIKIIYTGLRPGEKLFEELLLQQEGIDETAHDKVWVLNGGAIEFEQVRLWLDDLGSIIEAKNVDALVDKLQEIVPEYSPSKELLSMCEVDRHDFVSKYRNGTLSIFRGAA